MEFSGHAAAQVKSARPRRNAPVAAFLMMILLQLPIGGFLVHGNTLNAEVSREGIFWVLTVLLIAYILMLERRPLSSVGLSRPTLKSVVFGVIGAIVMVAGMAAIYMVVFPALGFAMNEPTVATLKSMPLWFRVILILRAAVFEELYYRGFMIERLTELTRLRWLAALISIGAFTLAHLSDWGRAHLMIAGFGGIVLTVLYVFRRDLASNMIAHLVTDAVGLL